MMAFFRQWRRQRLLRRVSIPESRWLEASVRLPVLGALSAEEWGRLRELATLLLHEKDFVAAGDLVLDPAMKLRISLLACLPVLNLGLDWYDGWRTVVVYPGGFLARHRYQDEAGVEHLEESALVGEAWEEGPVVLSWEDVAASGECDGFNVVIHEFAHKLDMCNGDANGFPPLHADMRVADWTKAMEAAFADLTARVDAGEAELPLDPYATESPGEFFAVISEAFFEIPDVLAGAYPAVYAQLVTFYRQDPLARKG